MRSPRVRVITFIPSTCCIYPSKTGQYRTSVCSGTLSISIGLVCSFCPSGQDFAAGFLQIPPRDGHPCLKLTLPTAKCVRDFHPIVMTHAGRTEGRNASMRQHSFLSPIMSPNKAFLSAGLPDLYSLFLRTIKAVSRFYIEGFIKGIHVAQRTIAAPFIRSMWVGDDPRCHFLVPGIGSPNLGPAKEETLFPRESIDPLLRFALLGFQEGFISNGQASQISQVFTQGQLAVHRQAIQDRELIILIYQF